MTSTWKHARCSALTLLALGVLMLFVVPIQAAENKASVDVRQGKGFARLVFDFQRPPEFSSNTLSTVFVLKFEKPIVVDLAGVVPKLRDIVTIARRDPDGYGLRFAMTSAFKVNVMKAGQFIIVDFLAKNWRGQPPGMPQDVVDELARQAEVARLAAAELARQKALLVNPLLVEVHHGAQPTFNRIQFNWNRFVTAELSRKGSDVTILFGGRATPDLAHLKIRPPKNLKHIHYELGKNSLRIKMKVLKGTPVRAFREGNNYVVDLTITKHKKLSKVENDLYAAANGNKTGAKTVRQEEVSLPDSRLWSHRDKKQANRNGQEAARVTPPKPAKTKKFNPPLPVHSKRKMKKIRKLRASRKPALKPQAVSVEPEKKEVKAIDALTKPLAKTSKPGKAQIKKTDGLKSPAVGEVLKPASGSSKTKTVNKTMSRGSYNPLDQKRRPEKTKAVSAKRDQSNKISIIRNENSVKLQFPFKKKNIAAAIFQRNENLWILIDSSKKLNMDGLKMQLGGVVDDIRHQKLGKSQLFEFHLSGPWLSSVSHHAANWTISIGDLVTGSSEKYEPVKQISSAGVEEVFVPAGAGGKLHQIKDRNSGDDLLVVTSMGPARSLKKVHDQVEFQLFKTIHGLVVRPLSDELRVSKTRKGVKIVGNNGLYLSGSLQEVSQAPRKPINKRRMQARKLKFSGPENETIKKFIKHTLALEQKIVAQSGRVRRRARLELARHWLSRGFAPEGQAMLSIAATENVEIVKDPVFRLMRGISNVMLRRYKAASKDLETNDLEDNPHASLWRGVAAYKQKKFDRALAERKRGQAAIKSYLPRQQAMFHLAGADAAIEQSNAAYAGSELDNLPQKGMTPLQTAMSRFLEGRLMELQNRPRDALQLYAEATKANIRPITAKAVFHLTDLRLRIGEIKSAAGISILERLSVVWRGDDVELQVLHRLADLHLAKGRYGAAFSLMETAVKAYPGSEQALALQDRMKAQFVDLFLQGKADTLPPVKALALFYDHKHLTPPGRLGDEMIRRLADRLINVDLLGKAASLLEHQVTRRLKGAGRAQVAIRLAMIHLLQHRPKLALKTIYRSRQAGLPTHVREARKLLEARAYAELGRSGPALELLASDDSTEAAEIKSLALWNGQKWVEAGEQFEKNLGNTWQSSEGLSNKARVQVLRAAISYTLGGDKLGVGRLRDKYAAKMSAGADAKAFAMITDPLRTNAVSIDRLARDIADIDTLEAFVKVFRQRLERTSSPQTTSAVE